MSGQYKTAWLCEALLVSRSGYYAWIKRRRFPGPRQLENMRLRERIREEFMRSRQTYGSRTSTSSLLIALNAYWEHTWRPDISAAIDRPKREDWVQSDLWGEVCKIRDCILHNKTRANADYERRAKILKWFKDGDSIEITSAMFTTFISQARAYCETFVVESYENRPNA
jgi:hypothetical protein